MTNWFVDNSKTNFNFIIPVQYLSHCKAANKENSQNNTKKNTKKNCGAFWYSTLYQLMNKLELNEGQEKSYYH